MDLSLSVNQVRRAQPGIGKLNVCKTSAVNTVVILTCVMQVKGQHKVQEDVRQLLRWVRRKPVLHHAQEKLNKVSI